MSDFESIVFLIDDDPSFRRSSERLLRLAGYEAQSFASALEFLNIVRPDLPACVVTDISMPGLSGLDLQQELVRSGSRIPVIFITGHGDVPTSVRAMKAGAIEFLIKPFYEHEFLDAINQALGRDRIRREQQARLAGLRRQYDSLTPREVEVFRYVVAGLLNKQIAGKLRLTEKTVKFHRANIMSKMRSNSLAHLVRMAAQLNVLDPMDPPAMA